MLYWYIGVYTIIEGIYTRIWKYEVKSLWEYIEICISVWQTHMWCYNTPEYEKSEPDNLIYYKVVEIGSKRAGKNTDTTFLIFISIGDYNFLFVVISLRRVHPLGRVVPMI